MSKFNVFVLIFVIELIVFTLISVPVTSHFYKGVKYSFDSEIDQCKDTLDNYNDKTIDLINYERTNTDRMSIDNSYQLEKCRKYIKNQNYYLTRSYIFFWTGVILLHIVIIVVLSINAAIIDDFN